MKQLLLIISIFTTIITFSNNPESDCYQHYQDIFDKRGAYTPQDTTYDKVIITIRGEEGTECFYGKVEVKNGIITKVHVLYADKTYGLLEVRYKDKSPMNVYRGKSRTKITSENEKVDIFILQLIKPKPKKRMKAPLIKESDL